MSGERVSMNGSVSRLSQGMHRAILLGGAAILIAVVIGLGVSWSVASTTDGGNIVLSLLRFFIDCCDLPRLGVELEGFDEARS